MLASIPINNHLCHLLEKEDNTDKSITLYRPGEILAFDLGNLNEDPKTWGLERNVYDTPSINKAEETEGPKIDLTNKEQKKKTSILETPVSETNNMEQTSGQGNNFNFQNQGNFNFNSV